MQIHELNDYSGNLDTGAYLAVDNGADTGKVSAKGLLDGVERQIDQLDEDLNGRIDNIIAGGAAPSEAEIVDARHGENGINYASLGAAIRGQYSEIMNELDGFENDVATFVEPINILDPATLLIGYNRPWNNPSQLWENENKVTFDFIPVKGGKLLYFDRGNLTKQTPDNFVEWDINKNVLVSNADCPRTLNENTKFLSISMAKTTYDAWKNSLQLEYDEMRSFSPYFKPYWKIEANDIAKSNKEMLSIAHQGYSADGTGGHSKVEGYINAAKYGFDYGETDLIFSSDNIAMCCHDASFVDATTGTTIVISEHTASELQNYNYYGGKIATFDEVVKTCKENGIGLVVDHVTEADSGTRFTDVMATVKKYQMQDSIIWLVGRESMINTLISWYKKVKVYIPVSSQSTLDIVIGLANRVATDFNEIGLSLNHENFTVADVQSVSATLPASMRVQCWTIDNAQTYQQYLPYVSGITSNSLNTLMLG